MPSLRLCFVLIAAVFVCFFHLPANASRKHPRFLVLSVQQYDGTELYTVQMAQGTPMRDLQLFLDIEQDYTWVRCYNNSYVSSTYGPIGCSTRLCKSYEYSACYTCFGPRGPGCNNHSCSVPEPSEFDLRDELGQDVAALLRSDGQKYPVHRLPFACAKQEIPFDLLYGWEFFGMDGLAGMSSSTLALPAQLSAVGRFSHKFTMCLPLKSKIDGYLSFGDAPLFLSPLKGGNPTDFSRHLIHTPLIKNPIKIPNSNHASTHGFYIGVQGIRVNGVDVPIDAEKLRIGTTGRGGTKLSTVVRYTQLATPIYNSLMAVYTQSASEMNIKRVDLVEPYAEPLDKAVCFDSRGTGQPPFDGSTEPGPNVPTIDLVLQGNVTWTIVGANSMERDYTENALCLAFVDAGEDPEVSIVIGTYQLQEILLQFDIGRSTLGFSSNLLQLPYLTSCGNFNTTSTL